MPVNPVSERDVTSKVPGITVAFWIVKICATTLGETGGDTLSMSLHLGYLVSTFIFLAFFLVTLTFQMLAGRYRALTYWLVVVATTTLDHDPRFKHPRHGAWGLHGG